MMEKYQDSPQPRTRDDCNSRGLPFMWQGSPNLTDRALSSDGVSGSVGYI